MWPQCTGSFFVSDGKAKPSTNGTWYRLSPPQQKSAPHEVKPSMEILIGNVRFQASERMTVTEENIDDSVDVRIEGTVKDTTAVAS